MAATEPFGSGVENRVNSAPLFLISSRTPGESLGSQVVALALMPWARTNGNAASNSMPTQSIAVHQNSPLPMLPWSISTLNSLTTPGLPWLKNLTWLMSTSKESFTQVTLKPEGVLMKRPFQDR